MGVYRHHKRVCTESWLWEKQSLAATGNRTCVSGMPVWCCTKWATSPPQWTKVSYHLLFLYTKSSHCCFSTHNLTFVSVPKTSFLYQYSIPHICFSKQNLSTFVSVHKIISPLFQYTKPSHICFSTLNLPTLVSVHKTHLCFNTQNISFVSVHKTFLSLFQHTKSSCLCFSA